MMIKTNLYLACINIFRNKRKITLAVILMSLLLLVLLICVLLLFGFITLSSSTTNTIQNNGSLITLSNLSSPIHQNHIEYTYVSLYKIGTKIGISMTIISTISVISVMYILFINRINKSQRYISSLKAIGYDDKMLTKMITMEHTIILLLSYTVATILSLVAILGIQHIVYVTLGVTIPVYYAIYALLIIPLLVFNNFITHITYKVIKKRNIL